MKHSLQIDLPITATAGWENPKIAVIRGIAQF
jgi:hypothetical protein